MDSMSTSVRVSSKRFITRSRSLDGGWRGDYARGADPCKRSTRPLHPDDSGQDLTWPPNQCDVAAGTSFGEDDCCPFQQPIRSYPESLGCLLMASAPLTGQIPG